MTDLIIYLLNFLEENNKESQLQEHLQTSQIFFFLMNPQEIWIPAQQVSLKFTFNKSFSTVAIMDLILNINRVGPQGEGE